MPASGWKQLLAGYPWFQGEGRYPIAAYSEFMPPPRLGRKPYGSFPLPTFDEDDPWGFPVTEYEEAWQLRPGLANLARELVGALANLGEGGRAHCISKHKLTDNPYWPPELARQAGSLPHERYVVLLPLALARSQDDKGRVRWTLFGGSEQGPARAFWRGFFTAPGREAPAEQGPDFIRQLLRSVYGEAEEKLADLLRAGFRILPRGEESGCPYWREDPWPSWTAPYLWSGSGSPARVKYLLTFRPFAALPAGVRRAYLAGELRLLPFPGSLLFWGVPAYFDLQRQLPLALQIPLLHLLPRAENPHGIRVPQSGWLHEPGPGMALPPSGDHHLRQTYVRTHRWNRIHRHQDELDVLQDEDKVAHVLFSTAPNELGLYDKPMARNAQIWTDDHHLLLDGPGARRQDIKRAALHLAEGGLFGYRFLFPAMRVGVHEVYWHRPLAAYLSPHDNQPAVLADAPLGYLTAYVADRPDLERPVEMWPRLLRRELHQAALELFAHEPPPLWTTHNIQKLLDAHQLLGPLPATFARALVKVPKPERLEEWLETLPERAGDRQRGAWLAGELKARIEDRGSRIEGEKSRIEDRGSRIEKQMARPSSRRTPSLDPRSSILDPRSSGTRLPPALTLWRTARRAFEVTYWKTIAALAQGEFRNKDNADCVLDKVTQATLSCHHRDLEALGDYLIRYYTRAINQAGLRHEAWAGEHAFAWRTDFDFSWWGGWVNNQSGHAYERNIVVRIPGRDPGQAVIMADHYDTAYMYDFFEKKAGGNGARIAAAGADDNHSATAALMLAAPIFLELSKAGRLGCDIWLVHLTGEEFPADCLGARNLAQALVEGTLKVRLAGGDVKDLSHARVKGVYVSDMIAHNNDHDKNVFQIAPGEGRESAALALQAHLANETWNEWARVGNRRPPRKGAGPGRRSGEAKNPPPLAKFPLLHGEVRPSLSPRSTLYNTDGQIFSDAGVPAVLFMENYDINRSGYHDSQDTLANIDLDYGAALAATVIETVARTAAADDTVTR
jgi:Peptidase family M28